MNDCNNNLMRYLVALLLSNTYYNVSKSGTRKVLANRDVLGYQAD